MLFPFLNEQKQSRNFIQSFKGYNNNLKISEDEFNYTKNVTCELFPLLSTRKKRSTKLNLSDGRGLIAKDTLAWIDGNKLYYNGNEVAGLVINNQGPKQLISMGAYLCIFPDKVFLNTKDFTDHGSMEASLAIEGEVILTLTKRDGSTYENVSMVEPEEPKNGDLWLDTSQEMHMLKQYSSTSSMWVQIPTVYVKIQATGIGKGFKEGDGINISGLSTEGATSKQVEDLNGSKIIEAIDDNYIVIIGILDAQTTTTGITVERKLPEMDYITEAGNRLWGCKYGISNGKTLNEIYCCKLGDFKNWSCYQGLSTDSWTGSVGTDGEFTGAVTHLGYPIFFKEDCFHKIYVSSQGAHQIVSTEARGIQKGSWRSAVIVNETLFYKSRTDICAYDGSLPKGVSDALGGSKYFSASAGAIGTRYYISMADTSGTPQLFVYDTEKGIWNHEDEIEVSYFAKKDDELYALSENKIIAINGTDGELEADFEWTVDTGVIGLNTPDKKYLSRFNFRMSADKDTEINAYIEYDSNGIWEPKGTIHGNGLGTFTLPIAPKRCDHCKIRIEGTGAFKLYSIAKIVEGGSDN